MVGYLNLTNNPQIKCEKFFEVMRDFRKGGLTPINYATFIDLVRNLPPINQRNQNTYAVFAALNLVEISKEDFAAIQREVIKRGIAESKKCWHPESGRTTCNTNGAGEIIVTKAHSIQNNGILDKIAEDGHVSTYNVEKGEFSEKNVGKNLASIFWGFCNKHDAIFEPIEKQNYTQTEEQHFLFAYRGFVVSSHKKQEVSTLMDYGEQSENDIIENKKIFDKAILAKQYSVIKTEVIELDKPYSVAVSSSFYLDFDFEGNPIPHSEERMEDIFVTFFPTDTKSYFLISYFEEDEHLYKNLASQLKARNNLLSDITMLIAAHTENVYFSPSYYTKHIEPLEEILEEISQMTQFDIASLDDNNQITNEVSLTPPSYLDNPWKISFFH